MEDNGPNAYERYNTNQAIELNTDHPIQQVNRRWEGEELTQTQWNEILPNVMEMLAECTELWPEHWIGPDCNLKTIEEAKQASRKGIDDC